MADGYMDASEAAYETLMYLVYEYGAVHVLNDFFDYMDVDRQVEFVHDFIKDHDIAASEMDDDIIRTINEHYKKHC